jgi:hypothetical protein
MHIKLQLLPVPTNPQWRFWCVNTYIPTYMHINLQLFPIPKNPKWLFFEILCFTHTYIHAYMHACMHIHTIALANSKESTMRYNVAQARLGAPRKLFITVYMQYVFMYVCPMKAFHHWDIHTYIHTYIYVHTYTGVFWAKILVDLTETKSVVSHVSEVYIHICIHVCIHLSWLEQKKERNCCLSAV